MRHGFRVGVVIPALNEEGAIGKVLRDIPAWVDQTVVADNGSTDRTGPIALTHGADVVSEPERGYGAACQAGLKHLDETDIVVFLDADYSDRPEEMALIVDPIADGEVDLVIGSRVLGTAAPGALAPHQRFGNWLACILIHVFWRTRHTDLGPFRAISAAALKRLDMRDRAFGWTVEMQVKAAHQGLAARDVPVSYFPRIGTSKISGTLKGTVLAGSTILGVILRSAFRSHRARKKHWA
ncbi:MAG: glycosyltransferase family 2 protein [Hyphomicrobiales bacterium]